MKEFMFKAVFTDEATGETREMIKEYRAESFKLAVFGIYDYLSTNKTIRVVHDVKIYEEVE